jgi:hypothetical protein
MVNLLVNRNGNTLYLYRLLSPPTETKLSLSVGVPANREENPQKYLVIKSLNAKERRECGG